MSVVVAVKKNNKTVVCTDSQVNFGNMAIDGANYQSTKAWRWGGNIICRTGWEKYHLILKNYLDKQEMRELTSATEVADLFYLFWEHCKDEHGFVNYQSGNTNSPWLNMDSDFMWVNKNGIWLISSDLSVSEYDHFHATGSGRDWALGALSALHPKKNESASQIAKQAVKVACTYNVYCGGQIKTLTVR
ncbi:hypothetical protein AB833_10170 [Chromatiales bacterium (ex Bugula neritina AB1)]|nr:hypothetical protein AB833_10170 [Chromatiales bacterium (ex Bugula neritina AB1)]